MDDKKMILLSDVSKIYKIGDSVVRALDHADMYVDKGELVSVIGPSGSGKSTLMNIIGCLDTATSGKYFLDGQEIADYSKNDLARIRNKKIGFIFQDFNLLPKLTAYENVELPLIYQGLPVSKRKEQVEEALDNVFTGNYEVEKRSVLCAETKDTRLQHFPYALNEIARIAMLSNEMGEDIGARRLHAVFEELLEDVSFNAGGENMPDVYLTITADYVKEHLKTAKEMDMRRYIL